MKTNLKCYSVWPGVARVGVPTKVAVIPLEGKLAFGADLEYEIYMLPMTRKRTLAPDVPDFILKGTDGALHFDYVFESECEYYIRIFDRTDGVKGKKITQLSTYAVCDDLYNKRPLKGDLHVHSTRSDGSEEPGAVAANYRKHGMDFVALTDHNRYFPSLEMRDAYDGIKLGITLMHGEEVHTPVTNLHIVHVGGESSVTEIYVKEKDRYEAEVAEIAEKIKEGPYRERLARMVWATEKIHAAGGIAIYPHPYWIQNVYNIEDEFSRIIFESGVFDAYELVGGMETCGINLSVAFYNDLRAEGIKIPVVGSSDAHSTNLESGRVNNLYTVAWADDASEKSILNAVRAGNSVAVEAVYNLENEFRAYGSYRLVSFARYLIDNYFPLAASVISGEGALMRRHLYGDPTAAEALNRCADDSKNLYEYFYGRSEGLFPGGKFNGERLEFLNKWNKVWQDYSVVKKGSAI